MDGSPTNKKAKKLAHLRAVKKELEDMFILYLDSDTASDTEDRRAKLNCYLYHKRLHKKKKKKLLK